MNYCGKEKNHKPQPTQKAGYRIWTNRICVQDLDRPGHIWMGEGGGGEGQRVDALTTSPPFSTACKNGSLSGISKRRPSTK